MTPKNPCLSCGACCAYFRASFYWAEASDATPNGVPVELTEFLGTHFRGMKGTNQNNPRCVALDGEIGKKVSCSIYGHRPQICSSFEASWSNGKLNERCDQTRKKWGLEPLTPKDR